MSDTPRTDAADLYDYQTAVEVCGELERELANAIAERDSETRWADKYAAESYRLEMICQSAHDRLLRGDSDKELLAILEEAWKGRSVDSDDRRARIYWGFGPKKKDRKKNDYLLTYATR